jgi:hypothetical protein
MPATVSVLHWASDVYVKVLSRYGLSLRIYSGLDRRAHESFASSFSKPRAKSSVGSALGPYPIPSQAPPSSKSTPSISFATHCAVLACRLGSTSSCLFPPYTVLRPSARAWKTTNWSRRYSSTQPPCSSSASKSPDTYKPRQGQRTFVEVGRRHISGETAE